MQALTHKEKPYEYRISDCLTNELKILRIYYKGKKWKHSIWMRIF
jgi:hypothetical protein